MLTYQIRTRSLISAAMIAFACASCDKVVDGADGGAGAAGDDAGAREIAARRENCATTVYTWTFAPEQAPWTFVGFSSTEWATPDSGGNVVLPDVSIGDLLLVDAVFDVENAVPFSGTPGELRMVAVAPDASVSPVHGAASLVDGHDAIAQVYLPGAVVAQQSGAFEIMVEGRVGGTGDALRVQGRASIRVAQDPCGVQVQASAP